MCFKGEDQEGRAQGGDVFPISGFQEGGVFLKDEVETLPQLQVLICFAPHPQISTSEKITSQRHAIEC